MATYTSYLNLEKPTTSETFNLLKMNQNWDKIDAGVSALNSKFTNSVCSGLVTTTSGESVRITASNARQGFLIFGGTNNTDASMLCLINIDSRMTVPRVLNLGNFSVSAVYGDSNVIIDVHLINWSSFVVLSEKAFNVSAI